MKSIPAPVTYHCLNCDALLDFKSYEYLTYRFEACSCKSITTVNIDSVSPLELTEICSNYTSDVYTYYWCESRYFEDGSIYKEYSYTYEIGNYIPSYVDNVNTQEEWKLFRNRLKKLQNFK